MHIGELLVRSTANHPFWVAGRGWIPAAKLQVGDCTLGHDGQLHRITDLFDNGDVEPVFNFAVAEGHTYFVASGDAATSALVHNDYNAASSPSDSALGGYLGLVPANLTQNSAANGLNPFSAASGFGPTLTTGSSVASSLLGSSFADSTDGSSDTTSGTSFATAPTPASFQNPNQTVRHIESGPPEPNDPFSGVSQGSGLVNERILWQTDAAGATTYYSYNPAGQLTEEQDPNCQTILYAYNAQGLLATETDEDGANSTETEYTYDAAGHVTSESQVSGGITETTSYQYDSSGNVVCQIDPDGGVTTFAYNSANQVVSETWYASVAAQSAGISSDAFVYAYNAAGLLVSAGDDNSSYTFTYDVYGRLLTVDNARTPNAPRVVLTYSYAAGDDNPNAKPVCVIATDGAGNVYYEDDYTYDANGNETSVTQTAPGQTAETVNFSYTAAGQLAEVDRYEGSQLVTSSAYTYDASGNLLSLDNTNAAGQTIDDFNWTYQPGLGSSSGDSATAIGDPATAGIAVPSASSLPASLVSTFTSSVDGTASYGYDADGQLTGATYTGSQANESYTYDQAGNRTSATGQTIIVGPFNKISSDGAYNYQYDPAGDLVRQTTIATGAYVVYSYDNRGRLTSVENFTASGVATQLVTYAYDVFNNLIGRTLTTYTNGAAGAMTTQAFVFDSPQNNGQMVLAFQTTGSAAPSATNLTDRYLWGPAVDQLLADNQSSGATSQGDVLWTITDNQNTIRDVVNSAGQVLDHIAYSAFGQPLSHTASDPAAVDTIFGHTGKFYDPATGLQWNENRWYNPVTGTWMTPDPDQADVNSRRYVGNSPTNGTDLKGLWWLEVIWGGVQGTAQGVANVANAATDIVIGAANTPALAWNYTAGWVAPNAPYIPSPDWSKSLIVDEGGLHGLSKGAATVGLAVASAIPAAEALLASRAAAAARLTTPAGGQLQQGATVYRVIGGQANEFGASWTVVDPTVIPNFRAGAGLFPGNAGEAVVTGRLLSTEGVFIKVPAVGPTTPPGALLVPEVIVPYPALQINITTIVNVKPPF